MIQLKNLITPNYYLQVLKGEKRFRVFLAAVVLALITTIPTSYVLVNFGLPIARDPEGKALAVLDEVYPEKLEIKIKKGKVSTNQTEPYFITTNKTRLENLFLGETADTPKTNSKIRLMVIDTKSDKDDFDRYQTLSLLTEDSLFYADDDGVKSYSLNKIEDLTVTKQFLISKIKAINKNNIVGTILTVGLYALPLIIFLFTVLGQIILFLILSLGVWLMNRILKLGISFNRLFVYTSALAFLPTLIWALLSFVPVISSYTLSIPTLPTVIILGLAYLGLKSQVVVHNTHE